MVGKLLGEIVGEIYSCSCLTVLPDYSGWVLLGKIYQPLFTRLYNRNQHLLQSCRKPVTRTVAKVEIKQQLEHKLAEGKEIAKELIANARHGSESAEAESYGDEDEEDTVDEAPSIVDEISAKGHKKLATQGALSF